MAKELPYFQFEPSEWQNGDIQMVSDKAKIAYIEICCTYWQRVSSLPYAFALQKHCNGNTELMQELISCNAIKVKDEKICISFLDFQLKTIEEKSEKARESALKRWNNANAMRTHSESNAIREDKIREDKIREDKFNFKNYLIDLGAEKNLVDEWLKVRKTKKATNTETAFNNFVSQVKKSNQSINYVLEKCVISSWAGFKAEWLKKEKNDSHDKITF